MYLPTTLPELKNWGWDALDVIIVSGDSYIDSPYIGAAIIGRAGGCRLPRGHFAQPDVNTPDDITCLGEPTLFWGVTAGCVI